MTAAYSKDGVIWHTKKHGNTGKTGQKGEAHHKAKLTNAQVLAMRARYVPSSKIHGATAIARDYGVSKSNALRIIRGEGWKHL